LPSSTRTPDTPNFWHLWTSDDKSIVPTPAYADDDSIFPLPLDDRNEGVNEGGTPTSATNNHPHVIDFLEGDGKFCLPTVEEAEDDESKLDNPTHELLLYHYRLAHEPFKNLQQMAQDSILPK
jgi:hypothetical protein